MPDVRLIDANALVKTIESVHCKDCNNYNGAMCRACTWMDAMDYIEDAPTIDAQPVKHGKWIPNTSLPGQTGFHCSECMFTDKGTYSRRFKRYKRCPNCGADMRGDSDADS